MSGGALPSAATEGGEDQHNNVPCEASLHVKRAGGVPYAIEFQANLPLKVLNIPIPATALSPPLTPPPAPELHQQSRPRFVWTPELHAQFEAACNTLGLDNAKPKSILKLMDVDGLTKANIKSHLQKYRCMMNKRSAGAGDGDGEARPAKAPRVQRRGSSGSVARSSSAASFDSSSDAACSPRTPGAADAHALHQNLEAQETTLREQMALQRQLSDQLKAQRQQQAELQLVVQARRQVEPHPGDEAAASKMASLQQLKAKLQTDLREHLRMQQNLLAILRDLSGAPAASTTAY